MSIRKQTRKWKQRDGKKIRICDLDDRHLINTILMLHRYAGVCRQCQLDSLNELSAIFNNDDIERQFDIVLGSTEADYIPDGRMYEALVLDLERRNIDWKNTELGEPIETWVL